MELPTGADDDRQRFPCIRRRSCDVDPVADEDHARAAFDKQAASGRKADTVPRHLHAVCERDQVRDTGVAGRARLPSLRQQPDHAKPNSAAAHELIHDTQLVWRAWHDFVRQRTDERPLRTYDRTPMNMVRRRTARDRFMCFSIQGN